MLIPESVACQQLSRYSRYMRMTPRTEAGNRTMARAPKADMLKVTAYEATPAARLETWLSFEREYHSLVDGEIA